MRIFLAGGEGSDRMTGNQGKDRFVFQEGDTGKGPDKDYITDFKVKDDLIVLKYDDIFAYIGGKIFTGGNDGAELRLNGNTLQGDTDGDGDADIEIMLLGLKLNDVDALEDRLVQGNDVTEADFHALQDDEDWSEGAFQDL